MQLESKVMKTIFNKIYHSKYFPRFFYTKFDGGEGSGVRAYFLIELKVLFSIGLLHFKQGSRQSYHSHAFNAITWWLTGHVTEQKLNGAEKDFSPSFKPKITKRSNFHKVFAHKSTWALTFRGPWEDTWFEYNPKSHTTTVLTHGREVIKGVK